MQNVVAINAAARQGIIAAQATSDEMLLQSIADGGRTAMHILYSRHNVRVYRFILRIVRDTTAETITDTTRTEAQAVVTEQQQTTAAAVERVRTIIKTVQVPVECPVSLPPEIQDEGRKAVERANGAFR